MNEMERQICLAYGVDPDTGGIPEEILKVSLEYSNALGMPISALDFGITEDGPVLFEINFNPGPQIHHYNGHTSNGTLLDTVQSHGIMDDIVERSYVHYPYEYLAAANLLNAIGRSLAFGLPRADLVDRLEIDVEQVYGRQIRLSQGGSQVEYVSADEQPVSTPQPSIQGGIKNG